MSTISIYPKRATMLMILAALIWLIAGNVLAIMPPADQQEIPPGVADACEKIAQQYGSNGIAARLQAIKYQNELDAKDGLPMATTATSWTVPVLVGSYSDNANIFSAAQFQTQLFGANPTGSMTDYYNEISYGQFSITGTVYGPYTASNTQAYYENGNNGMSGAASYPQNASGFIVSLLTQADPAIDFSQYDNDGPDGTPNSGDDDGYVDAIIVIFPDGDASGGDSDNIWAHQYRLAYGAGSVFTTNDAKTGGGSIMVDTYTIQGGEQGNGTTNVIKPIGVYCHEFGHVLGLPDLYDIDNSSYGVGTWCLMSSGSWGANWNSTTEHKPLHMNAWCKTQLGWLTPTVVSGTQAVQIPPVETTATVYKLWDDAYQGGRYFLLENRTQTGFDADIPGEGVLVWHCNDEVFHTNMDDSYRLVDLEEADGLNEIDSKLDGNDAGDLYPGSTNNATFNDASSPSAKDVFGTNTGASATSFTNGPGSNVSVTLTQRSIDGYTLYKEGQASLSHWGFATAVVSYGALKLTATTAGNLVAIQAGMDQAAPVGYSVRIFDDMISNSPSGLNSITTGNFPNVVSDRYHQITLSSALPLSAGQTFVVDVAWGPDDYAVPFTSSSPISGNSYFSGDGTNYSAWADKDVAIRARIQASGLGISDGRSTSLPEAFALDQNYPNPFNPSTVIPYSLPTRTHVEATIYNLLGQHVVTLVNETQPAGHHTVTWKGINQSGNDIASGIYLYRFKAGDNVKTRKMILLR